ncbi:MAG: hypothetical protein ACM3KH_00755 [Thiobacillus sp.]
MRGLKKMNINAKKILIATVFVLILIGASVGTIQVLKNIFKDSNSPTVSSLNAADVIDQLSDSDIFNSNTYTSHPNGIISINYQPNGKKKEVSLNTNLSLGYYAISNDSDNPVVTIKNVKDWMANHKLTYKGEQRKGILSIKTFDNSKTVCQLISSTGSKIRNSYRIGCVSSDETNRQN